MLKDLNDARRVIQNERGRSEPVYDDRAGTIVSVNGSTSVPNLDGYLWVQEFNTNGSPAAALNDAGVVDTAGTPVIVRIVSDKPLQPEMRIIGLYTDAVAPGTSVNIDRYGVALHRENHQWPSEASPGIDPVRVYEPAWMPLKTIYDGSSLVIDVNPLSYSINGGHKYFAGQRVNLTSYVPSTSGRAVRVLVYLNATTNQIAVATSAEVTAALLEPPYVDLPENGVGSAYIKLTNGQTVSNATHYDTARNLMSPYVVTNLSNTPAASTVDIESSTGSNTTIPAATTSLAGVMTAADKTKLANVGEGARVFNTSSIPITSGVVTTLTYNSEDYDDDNYHSTVSLTGRLVVPSAGRYTIGCNIAWDSNSTGYRELRFRLNGSTIIGRVRHLPVSGATSWQALNVTLSLSANDYIESQVVQTSGGVLDVALGGNASPYFWITRIQ